MAKKDSKTTDKGEENKKPAKEPKAEKPKVEKDTQNGITRPMAGVTQAIWILADKMSNEAGAPIKRAELVKAFEGNPYNGKPVEIGTIHTQFGRWSKYYGLSETKEARQARLAEAREKKEAAKKASKEAADAKKAELAAEAAKAQGEAKATKGNKKKAATPPADAEGQQGASEEQTAGETAD